MHVKYQEVEITHVLNQKTEYKRANDKANVASAKRRYTSILPKTGNSSFKSTTSHADQSNASLRYMPHSILTISNCSLYSNHFSLSHHFHFLSNLEISVGVLTLKASPLSFVSEVQVHWCKHYFIIHQIIMSPPQNKYYV